MYMMDPAFVDRPSSLVVDSTSSFEIRSSDASSDPTYVEVDWGNGSTNVYPAPFSHSKDTTATIRYRGVDASNNRETTWQQFAYSPQSQGNSPTISSVSPASLPTSASTQLINIYGANFKPSSDPNASTVIFHDPANNPYLRTPIYISANQLQYNITVASAIGTWSVTVTNAGRGASNPQTFTVYTPAANAGSLTVNLSPAGAVSAGAQWRVDSGIWHNSGDTATGLTPGAHPVSFKTAAGYTAPADHGVIISGSVVTSDTGTYTVVPPSNYILTLNQGGAMGSITPSPLGTWNGADRTYTAGSIVQLTATANPGYHFVSWGGDVVGSGDPTSVTMNANKSVSASFAAGDPNMGTVTVNIQPSAAAAAGVSWGFNADDYRPSGSSYTTWPGTYYLTIHPVDGWLGSVSAKAVLTAGQTTSINVTFTQDTTPGFLTVTLTPPNVASAGAKWHANGGAAQGSGTSLSLQPGTYVVTFDSLSGWTAPSSQTVTVSRAQTVIASGAYTPPGGQPGIVSINPSVGALAGGTPLTIQGFGFTTPATVSVGGRPATGVSVVGTSQITCFTPTSTVYGTAPIVVQTPGGIATNSSGFAYGFPRGNGIQLAGSVGGYLNAMAVQGNYGYSGEGSTFIVFDLSNTAAPTPVARLALPGLVQDVALFSVSGRQYAAVANYDSGLQIIDITTPTAPALRGYYNTGDYVSGVAVSGSIAYLANGNSGLMVCDISNPAGPQRVTSLSIGNCDRLIVQASGSNLFAYVSSGGALAVVDVTNPSVPVLRGTTASITQSWERHSLAFLNSRVYLADGYGLVQAIDVSNPTVPTALGAPFNGDTASAVASANGYIYAWSNVGMEIYNFPGGVANRVGAFFPSGLGAFQGNTVAILGGTAICTGGENGFQTINVSTPSNPSSRGAYTTTAGYYLNTAVNGNTVFSTTQNSGLKVFNVNTAASPTLLSLFATAGGASVSWASNRLYTLSKVLDVANPSSPQLLGSISSALCYALDFYMIGNRMVTCGSDTNFVPSVAILNTANPAAIGIQGICRLSSTNGPTARPITGNNALACVAVPDKTGVAFSLSVVNVSNLASPQQVGQLNGIGNVKSMRLAPDSRYLYVGGWSTDLGWKIIDIANSNAPVIVCSTYLGVGVFGFDFAGTTAYLATGNGVLAYDVSNPSNPQLLRSYSTPSIATAITVSGNTLYVSDGDGGLTILQLADLNAPQTIITSPSSSPVWTNTTGTLDLGGSANDNLGLVHGSIARVTWANDRGGGGTATGTTNWSVTGLVLLPGTNVLTVSTVDTSGNNSNAVLTVIYQSPNQDQTIVFSTIPDHTFGDAPVVLTAAASSGLPVSFSVVSGAATLTNSILALIGAGSVTVQANQCGNGSFNAAPLTNLTFNVAKAEQSITFAVLPDRQADSSPFMLSASSSSGLPVTFGIMSSAAVLETNLVTLLGGGMVTVSAWQPGNSNYNAALPVQRNFNVTAIPQTITFGPLSRQTLYDAPFPVSAAASSGLPVDLTIVSGPARMDGNIVTVTNKGLVILRASQPGNATYAPAANVDRSLVVAPGNNLITDAGRLPTGHFAFTFAGEFDRQYVVECSTNASPTGWMPLATNVVDGLGNLEFTDWLTTNRGQGFYRVKVQ